MCGAYYSSLCFCLLVFASCFLLLAFCFPLSAFAVFASCFLLSIASAFCLLLLASCVLLSVFSFCSLFVAFCFLLYVFRTESKNGCNKTIAITTAFQFLWFFTVTNSITGWGGCTPPNPPRFFKAHLRAIKHKHHVIAMFAVGEGCPDPCVCNWGGAAPPPTPPLL